MEWDLHTGQQLKAINAGQFREGETAIAISDGGHDIALRHHRSTEIRNRHDFKLVSKKEGCEGANAILFNENKLITLDGSWLYIWNDYENSESESETISTNGIWVFSLSPDKTSIAVAGSWEKSPSITIHSAADYEITEEVSVETAAESSSSVHFPSHRPHMCSAIEWSPKGGKIFVGTWGGDVRVFDVDDKSWNYIGKLREQISFGKFSLDEEYLFGSGEGGYLYVWNLKDKSFIAIQAHPTSITGLLLIDEEIITSGMEGRIRFWSVQELLALFSTDALNQKPKILEKREFEIRCDFKLQRIYTKLGSETLIWSFEGDELGRCENPKGERASVLDFSWEEGRLQLTKEIEILSPSVFF